MIFPTERVLENGMEQFKIPFNKPAFEGKELAYMAQAVGAGKISGDGEFTHKCHAFLEKQLGVRKALLTTSCTDALEMSALLLGIKPGDEVIAPSYAFTSTVNAFVLHGAIPVFIDIRPDTLNMDESLIERLITSRTKAIVVLHYAGVGCEMDTILEIAERHGVAVIEDNAHGLFGKYKGKYLGRFAPMATLSFHETKNFTCGEGGALLINSKDLIERAEIIREKGTDRSRFFRGQVKKYSWVNIGSSYLPSDLLAAFLYAQFEARNRIQKHRQRIWEHYNEHLREWAGEHRVRLPFIPDYCEQAYHMFYLIMPSPEQRDAFIDYLKKQGIFAAFHYLPLHLSGMGVRFGGHSGDCPVTEDISARLVRLPFYNSLAKDLSEQVVSAVGKFHRGAA